MIKSISYELGSIMACVYSLPGSFTIFIETYDGKKWTSIGKQIAYCNSQDGDGPIYCEKYSNVYGKSHIIGTTELNIIAQGVRLQIETVCPSESKTVTTTGVSELPIIFSNSVSYSSGTDWQPANLDDICSNIPIQQTNELGATRIVYGVKNCGNSYSPFDTNQDEAVSRSELSVAITHYLNMKLTRAELGTAIVEWLKSNQGIKIRR
jgi:hypothetical protein